MDRENKVIIDVNDPAVFGTAHEEVDDLDTNNEPEMTPEEQVARFLDAARREAEQIILEAQAAGVAEQAAMRNAAKSEIAIAMEQAKEQGYQEGMTAATREGDSIRAQARKVLTDAEAERIRMQESLEPEMVDLLMQIAAKLLNNAVVLHPDIILALVQMGIKNATITGDIIVYVSADDYDITVENRDKIMALTDGSVKLEIVKDLSLNPMDCVIETPFGNIDCSLGQQFNALRANITYLLNG
jgi:flagellar assembly protein FliH